MFVPKINEETDQAWILDFIRQNAFGILVNVHNNVPTATHIPIELCFNDKNEPILRGHIAKANPQWQLWENKPETLAIFTGAHSYISSSWYENENVSTWNYAAVHIYGTIQILDADTLFESLKSLTNKYEYSQEKPLNFEQLDETTIRKMMKGIVGFEMPVQKVEANVKLSQNRNDKDYKNIITQLYKTDDAQAHGVAQEMTKRRV